MRTVDVGPTAEVIEKIAERLADYSRDLARLAKKMRENNDLTFASEAVQIITNSMNAFRLDLLVTRPLREMERVLKAADRTP